MLNSRNVLKGNEYFVILWDVLQNNGSSVALRVWRHGRTCYVRENDVREVSWCLVVGGVFGSMLEGKCDGMQTTKCSVIVVMRKEMNVYEA